MTVSTTTSRVEYAGNGSTTAFSVPFYFLANGDLKVYQGGVLKTITTHYTVSGAGNPAGGTVTFVTAPASTDDVVIFRDPALTQTTDYAPNDPFPAESHERALDRLTMIAQRNRDLLDRAFVLQDGVTGVDTTLPEPSANKVVAWNSTGTALENRDATDFATALTYADRRVETFTGDGVTVDFTLAETPAVIANTDVDIEGVSQVPGIDYQLLADGVTLRFDVAPPNGQTIAVKYGQAVAQSRDDAATVYFAPAGTGAVSRSVQNKLRDTVSVFDFMTAAQIADVQARTFLVDTIGAIDAAIAAAPAVYFPPGGYLVSRAIAITGNQLNGKTLYGSQTQNTAIRRVTTNSEVISGNTVTCIMYVGGLDHNISNFVLEGAPDTNAVDGMYIDCARTTMSDVRANFVRNGFLAKRPYLCIFNRLWAKDASETGFDFSSSAGKTTLIFNNCTCENVGNAFLISFAYYSVMNSCAADYVNYTSTGNPYGTGYGSRASANAVYQFNGGDVVMNGCGAENSYGNGFVGFSLDQSTNVTANNCTAFTLASTYDPTATRGADWAVGAFQFANGPANLTINGGRYTFTNAVAPVVADLVAFNYDEGAYGIRNLSMVNVGSTVIPSNLANAFAGRGDFNRYCRIPINYRNQYTRRLSGTGTVITIPIVSQNSITQRHVIRLLAINRASNSTAVRGTEATIDFASLTTISSISYWNSKNITSVAASGMNLQITLTSALTTPDIVIEPLSTNQKLIDLSNITIA